VSLYPHFLDGASVPRECGRGAAKAGVLDAQTVVAVGVGRPRLLEAGAQRTACDGARRRAVGRQSGGQCNHAAVSAGVGIRLATGICHRHTATWMGGALVPEAWVVVGHGVHPRGVYGGHGGVSACPPSKQHVIQRANEQQECQHNQQNLNVERLSSFDEKIVGSVVCL